MKPFKLHTQCPLQSCFWPTTHKLSSPDSPLEILGSHSHFLVTASAPQPHPHWKLPEHVRYQDKGRQLRVLQSPSNHQDGASRR